MIRFLFGVMFGIIAVPLAFYLWFTAGKVPVAVADPPFPREKLITSVALKARIQREMIDKPPIGADESNLTTGARIYTERCSVCHGLHGKPSAIGSDMFPAAPRLLEKHRNSTVVGVSDDPTGETYWKVYNGIRLTGMPSYKDQLSETEMWQVSLFLAYADKPMPPAALEILRNAPAPLTGKHTQPAPPEEPAATTAHAPKSPETPEESEEPQQ
jgi:mono/diheme cytochrome c family protein